MAEDKKGGWDDLSTREKRKVFKQFLSIVGAEKIEGKSPEEVEDMLRKWYSLQQQYKAEVRSGARNIGDMLA